MPYVAVLSSSEEPRSCPSCIGGGHTRRLGEEEGIMTRAGYYRAAIVAIVLLGILGLALPAAAKDLVPFKGYVNLEVTAFDYTIGDDHATLTLSGLERPRIWATSPCQRPSPYSSTGRTLAPRPGRRTMATSSSAPQRGGSRPGCRQYPLPPVGPTPSLAGQVGSPTVLARPT